MAVKLLAVRMEIARFLQAGMQGQLKRNARKEAARAVVVNTLTVTMQLLTLVLSLFETRIVVR